MPKYSANYFKGKKRSSAWCKRAKSLLPNTRSFKKQEWNQPRGTLFSYLSEKLKEAIEMDLFDLKDMCNNNVQEWFESLVNDSGDNYEDQKAKYHKLKGQKGKSKEEP